MLDGLFNDPLTTLYDEFFGWSKVTEHEERIWVYIPSPLKKKLEQTKPSQKILLWSYLRLFTLVGLHLILFSLSLKKRFRGLKIQIV